MRLLLTGLIFVLSLAAAVLVHAPRAHAAWSAPQQIDAGSSPQVRAAADGGVWIAYAQGEPYDPSRLLVSAGNEPVLRVKVPRAGRVAAFGVDADGKLAAVRVAKPPRRARTRVLALEGSRWRAISGATTAVEPKLAVAASGAAVAAWLQKEQSHWVVHAALRPAGARRFGAAQRISGLTTRAGQPLTVAIDDGGTAVVAFAEGGDLTLARTVGGSFTTPVRVHDRTATVAGAYAVGAAVRGEVAAIAFTRLEDREPPAYRLEVATQTGDTAPVVETVATDVSSLDIAAAVAADGTPLALASPIGPPYSLRLYGRTGGWSERAALPATEAPSTIGFDGPCVTWTEGTNGFAAFGDQRLALGRAYGPVCAVLSDGSALAVWDRGPGRTMRLATFTP